MAQLKYPNKIIFDKTNEPLQVLLQRDTGSIEQPTIESQVFGIGASICLLLTILYMYYTSRSKLKFHITNHSATYTFSEAVQNSEKVGSTILIILFLAFLQALFTVQNFNNTYSFERSSMVCINYIVILGILLMFYIGPSKHIGHSTIAIILTLTVVFSAGMINSMYHKYYTDASLYQLNIICYIIYAFFAVLCIVFIILTVSKHHYIIIHHLLSISELSLLVLYAVFLTFFGQMPKLLSDDELSCVIVK